MINLELTLKSGARVSIFTDKVAVVERTNGGSLVVDGLHNNGGWEVQQDAKEVLAIIHRQVFTD